LEQGRRNATEGLRMKQLVLRFYIVMQELKNALKDESGQGMVEYALVMGLIAMGSVVAVKGLATSIGTGFTSIGTKLTTYTS
jgi:pilus assembly protein Flp/PilA